MAIKKISSPLTVALVSIALCFSLGFFENVVKYNGLKFFCAYAIFAIIFCYPVNLVALYISKAYPQLHTHSELTKKFIGNSKLRIFSTLLIATIIIILSLILFNISAYFLNLVENISAFNQLNYTQLNISEKLPSYIILSLLFISVLFSILLANKSKLNTNTTLKVLVYTVLALVLMLIFLTFFTPNSLIGINNFIFNSSDYQTNFPLHNMLIMAMLYAIISNFISLALYKKVLEINDKSKQLKATAFKIIFYNIIFSLIICIAIYSSLGNYKISIQPTESLNIATVLASIKTSSLLSYYVLEIIFIIFGLIVSLMLLNYLTKITAKLYLKIIVLSIPFIITISFITYDFTSVSFSTMFGLHLLIIYLFLFDLFVVGWLYDAQKISYEIIKTMQVKLSAAFNIMLRIVIPFVCIILTLGYILPTMSLIWQFLATLICMLIYIIKGTILNNLFNKRKL